MARQQSVRLFLAALCFALMPKTAVGQSGSGIAGVVKDTTGAVVPGVTVDASSPALIEKVRTAVTDAEGLYKITDLRPGTYQVTFSLPGFSTVKREGIELSALFTATVNVEMRVGALEETVTVSGQSPVVDVQNVTQQRVVTSEVIDALPTAKSFENLAVLIPGMGVNGGNRPSAQDVAGSAGERTFMTIHGGRNADMTYQVDGVTYNTLQAQGASSGFTPNTGEVQEYSYEVGALTAETAKGGIRMNVIPKEGGNLFKGTTFISYGNKHMTSDNLSSELKSRGLSVGNKLDHIWDLNPSFGGPIVRSKLWFFGSFRYWGLTDLVAGMYYDANPKDFVYTPDPSRQAIDDSWNTATGLRLTWQANPKNKFSGYAVWEGRCQCHQSVSATRAPEAAYDQVAPRLGMAMVTWSSPLTSRLLLEAGWLSLRHNFFYNEQPETTADLVGIVELSTNLNYRAASAPYNGFINGIDSYKGALSYVTGSHAVKVGLQFRDGQREAPQHIHGDLTLQLLNGVPRSIVEWTTPFDFTEKLNAELGIFAQDQWTRKRLTVNGGIRFDYLNASVAEQHLPAARLVPARDFAAVPDVPNWKNVSPRLGAAYDLFGSGRTALKVTVSRYVAGEAVDLARSNNPLQTSVNSATRTWTDSNGNFYPDCDQTSPVANGECGALSSTSFGQVRVVNRYDDPVIKGYGSRGFNWETSAGLQHELLPRVALNAAYFRRSYGNFIVTDNLLISPEDHDQYCITAPVDARLPGGGGNQICGYYDVKPAKFGQTNNLVVFAKNFGKQTEIFNGVDISLNARFANGAMLQAGTSTGRSATNNCFVVDSPQQLKFCDVKPPFQTQFKLLGTIRLPWHLQASGTYQSLPGPQITASYVATNAQISPSLGRNLANGVNGTATIPLVQPGTMYEARLNQVDTRVTRIFQVGRTRMNGNLDLYNVFNASPVLVLNNTYGPAWQQPSYILPGRMLKFGVQVDF